MARKSDNLTPRQRQSQRIMREKAAMKRRREILRRLQYAGAALAVVTGVGGGVWVWKNRIIERAVEGVVDGSYQLTVDAGFALESLYLEGRNRTSMAEIEKALQVKKGDPILRLPLSELRQRLQEIPSVKAAAVERALPDTLYVRIVEREPVALWQHKGKLALIDDNGVVMDDIDHAPYKHLPLVVGADAPQHVREVLAILSADAPLAQQFAAAVRVGERRWNFRLKHGVEVRLPEKNPEAAWKKLAEMHTRQQLLERNVQVIDLRVDGRLFIKLPPEDVSQKAIGAKET